MINLLIIEDEPIIARDIADALEDLGYRVTAICRNHREALDSLQADRPDLVLCDIHLEGDDWDGIRLAAEIRKLYNLPLIFLTALTDPATIGRAAEVEPDAYLTKPFEERTLYAAIELALSKFALRQDALRLPPTPTDAAAPPFIAGSFFIKDKKRLVKVSAEEILWVKADGVYSQLTTATRQYLLTTHLGAIEDKLQSLPFIRVHRSYLVNFQHVQSIEDYVLTIGTERIPLGKSYREEFYRRLQQL
ncbi:MAG: response regulator [Saprospiraceae bacterium]|nr:response regulator [Saprospiraceae bacterium]